MHVPRLLRELNLISSVQGPENQGPTGSLDAHLYLLPATSVSKGGGGFRLVGGGN
jgi:hypothetical protein